MKKYIKGKVGEEITLYEKPRGDIERIVATFTGKINLKEIMAWKKSQRSWQEKNNLKLFN